MARGEFMPPAQILNERECGLAEALWISSEGLWGGAGTRTPLPRPLLAPCALSSGPEELFSAPWGAVCPPHPAWPTVLSVRNTHLPSSQYHQIPLLSAPHCGPSFRQTFPLWVHPVPPLFMAPQNDGLSHGDRGCPESTRQGPPGWWTCSC